MATDKNRLNFLSGFKNSPQGAYEDPTYLGFKIFFDFDSPTIDEDGLPPSPLFRKNAYTNGGTLGSDPFGMGPSIYNPSLGIIYHSAQSYLIQREQNWVNAQRADSLFQFTELLRQINDQSPWFFQSIIGLDNLASVEKEGYNGSTSGEKSFDPQRTFGKSLTINCLESLNLRISALAELYRQSTFDYEYMREVVPRNLRKFRMWIYVSEVRYFAKTGRLTNASTAIRSLESTSNLISNGMNPGNSLNPGDSNGSSTASGSSQNSLVSGILNRSGLGSDADAIQSFGNQSDQSGITPFIIFECSQCEFDFDSSTPIKQQLFNGSSDASAETQSFKIYVGKVKTKIQFPNIRDDRNFLILSDGFNQGKSSNKKINRERESQTSNSLFSNALRFGESLLTNFVGNSVNNLVNTQVNRLSRALSGLDQSILGNVYSFNPGALINQPSFNTASDLADQFRNGLDLRSIFRGDSGFPGPQTNGLGGPPQRVYPSPGGDVYSGVPGSDLGVPDRVYPVPTGDVYPGVPGSDLGGPDRVYLQPSGDVYENVPGSDLGGSERVYRQPDGDVYENVPGADLGGPDRVYLQPSGDFYPDSPGSDLGVPDRVYPPSEGDVYPNVPGSDLGGPDRVYPPSEGDVYPNVPGSDLGGSQRIYGSLKDDVYPNVPGSDLGVPQRRYGLENSRVYEPDPSSSQSKNLGTLYDFAPSENEMTSTRVYPPSVETGGFDSPPANQYGPQIPKSPTRNLGDAYPPTSGDFSPEATNLGNLKPKDRYNFSLDDTNGIDED
jgi:hypothetical protein